MTLDTWLRMTAIGLPLIVAVAMRKLGDNFPSVQGRLVAVIFGLSGLTAFILFLLNKRYACTFVIGSQNCLTDGLATLSLFLLNVFLARACLIHRGGIQKDDSILMLLLSSAWAGMGLAENLLVLLIFLYLFFYVLHKWLERNGFKLRLLILRDDYQDEQNHNRDGQK